MAGALQKFLLPQKKLLQQPADKLTVQTPAPKGKWLPWQNLGQQQQPDQPAETPAVQTPAKQPAKGKQLPQRKTVQQQLAQPAGTPAVQSPAKHQAKGKPRAKPQQHGLAVQTLISCYSSPDQSAEKASQVAARRAEPTQAAESVEVTISSDDDDDEQHPSAQFRPVEPQRTGIASVICDRADAHLDASLRSPAVSTPAKAHADPPRTQSAAAPEPTTGKAEPAVHPPPGSLDQRTKAGASESESEGLLQDTSWLCRPAGVHQRCLFLRCKPCKQPPARMK